MRIYSINIDATPLFDCFRDLLLSQGFHLCDLLVNGLFTSSSVKAMYYGKVYDTIKTGDPFLIDILLENGYVVEVHESQYTFVPEYLGEQWKLGLYPTPRGFLRKMTPSLKNEKYGNVIVSSADPTGQQFSAWDDRKRYLEFMENEAAWVRTAQSEGGDVYTHIMWAHYHDFVYDFHPDVKDKLKWLEYLKQTLIDWLSLWNFDEPDALFYIFCDHGDHVSRLTPPKDYWRWCFIKDNSDDPIHPRKLINGADYFPTILDKLGRSAETAQQDCSAWGEPVDRDRIYYMADTRYWDENRSDERLDLSKHETHEAVSMQEVSYCMNATATRFIEWVDDETPSLLLQATYYRYTELYYFLLFEPDPNKPLPRTGYFDQTYPPGKPIQSLAGTDHLKPHMIELCRGLVDRFEWIKNTDYSSQIESDHFPEWFDP